MHAKQRNGRFQLYRSTYVRKGAGDNNTHGYAEQKFVGSLPADSLEIPLALAGVLSEGERRYIERKVIEPARQVAEAKRLAAEAHERDPNWRIKEAAGLLGVVRELLEANPGKLDATGTAAARYAMQSLEVIGGPSLAKGQADHPLKHALESVQDATRAVNEGRYGRAPAENVRASEEYQLWDAIKNAVNGDVGGSLLRALQDAGYVKARGK